MEIRGVGFGRGGEEFHWVIVPYTRLVGFDSLGDSSNGITTSRYCKLSVILNRSMNYCLHLFLVQSMLTPSIHRQRGAHLVGLDRQGEKPRVPSRMAQGTTDVPHSRFCRETKRKWASQSAYALANCLQWCAGSRMKPKQNGSNSRDKGLKAPRISPSSLSPKQGPALVATSSPNSAWTCCCKLPRNPVAKTITSALMVVPSANAKPVAVYDVARESDLTLIWDTR